MISLALGVMLFLAGNAPKISCSEVTRIEFLDFIPMDVQFVAQAAGAYHVSDRREILSTYHQESLGLMMRDKRKGRPSYTVKVSRSDFRVMCASLVATSSGRMQGNDTLSEGNYLVSWRMRGTEYGKLYSPEEMHVLLVGMLNKMSRAFKIKDQGFPYQNFVAEISMAKALAERRGNLNMDGR